MIRVRLTSPTWSRSRKRPCRQSVLPSFAYGKSRSACASNNPAELIFTEVRMFSSFSWKSLFLTTKPSARQPAARSAPKLELLEDRLAPSAAPTVNLSTRGSIGEINDAIFRQVDAQPTG